MNHASITLPKTRRLRKNVKIRIFIHICLEVIRKNQREIPFQNSSKSMKTDLKKGIESDEILDSNIEIVESFSKIKSFRKQNNEIAHRNKPLNKRAVKLMEKWYLKYIEYPYPNTKQKECLALNGAISISQVNSWFANRRNRSDNTKPKKNRKNLECQLILFAEELEIENVGILKAQSISNRLANILTRFAWLQLNRLLVLVLLNPEDTTTGYYHWTHASWSGPLFLFDARDDVRIIQDSSIEKRTRMPARWEPYDPMKNWDQYTVAEIEAKIAVLHSVMRQAGFQGEFCIENALLQLEDVLTGSSANAVPAKITQ